ncbi:MAG: hypothetical protein HYZ53_23325 [Planctomycetes bacterium]|nr:hypothetical protein [Planctomycetota bacterium]
MEKLEAEKESIFQAGAKTRSLARRKLYARRFGDLVARMGMLDRELNRGSKELLTLGRIRAALERSKSPLSAILTSVNDEKAAELLRLLEDDRIAEDVYLQKLDGLLGLATDPAYATEDVGPEGMEVLKTWEAMDDVADEDLEGPSPSLRKKKERKPPEPERDGRTP